jgi:hypothetical protein
MVDDVGPNEPDPAGQQDRQALLHGIVAELSRDLGGGADPEAVRVRLVEAVEAAGLPPQPQKWVDDTSAEVAAGRAVIVDRRENQAVHDADTARDTGPGEGPDVV